jgi:hypothetical protein
MVEQPSAALRGRWKCVLWKAGSDQVVSEPLQAQIAVSAQEAHGSSCLQRREDTGYVPRGVVGMIVDSCLRHDESFRRHSYRLSVLSALVINLCNYNPPETQTKHVNPAFEIYFCKLIFLNRKLDESKNKLSNFEI